MENPLPKIRAVIWQLTKLCALPVFLVFCFGCEELMNVDFAGDSSRTLVVEGAITTDTLSHKVILSYSGDFFEIGEKEMATRARVTISDGTDTLLLSEIADGVYATDAYIHGVVGRTYTLDIELQDGSRYSASDYLKACPVIDSIRQSVNYSDYSDYGYDVLFYGREPEPAGDHYMYLLYVDNKLYTDTVTEISFVSDQFVNGKYISDYGVYHIREADIKPAVTLVSLEMHTISQGFFEFLSALMVETVWRGSPWDGPPANVPGNISNGARGYFRASDVKRVNRNFIPSQRVN